MPPFLHVAVPGLVLLFLFPNWEICRPRNHHRGNPCIDGIAMVHVFGQLSGVGVQQTVDFFMVHGGNPGFLAFCQSGGLVYHAPVFFCGTAFFIIVEAVHFLCPAGGSFIDGIIVDRFHLLCTSGHDGPKYYRSSWEIPAFSLWGAGGDFWNCFSVSRMEGTERAFSG